MIVLAGVLVVIVVWHLYAERQWQAERQRLLNAVVARNAHELAGLDAVSNTKPKKVKEHERPVEQVGA